MLHAFRNPITPEPLGNELCLHFLRVKAHLSREKTKLRDLLKCKVSFFAKMPIPKMQHESSVKSFWLAHPKLLVSLAICKPRARTECSSAAAG